MLGKPFAPESIDGVRIVTAEEAIDLILESPGMPIIDSRKKAEFVKAAKTSRQRYEEAVANYKAPSQSELRKRKKTCPKGRRCSYAFYNQDNFGKMYRRSKNFGQTSKAVADKWKRLSEEYQY